LFSVWIFSSVFCFIQCDPLKCQHLSCRSVIYFFNYIFTIFIVTSSFYFVLYDSIKNFILQSRIFFKVLRHIEIEFWTSKRPELSGTSRYPLKYVGPCILYTLNTFKQLIYNLHVWDSILWIEVLWNIFCFGI